MWLFNHACQKILIDHGNKLDLNLIHNILINIAPFLSENLKTEMKNDTSLIKKVNQFLGSKEQENEIAMATKKDLGIIKVKSIFFQFITNYFLIHILI